MANVSKVKMFILSEPISTYWPSLLVLSCKDIEPHVPILGKVLKSILRHPATTYVSDLINSAPQLYPILPKLIELAKENIDVSSFLPK